MQATMPDVPKKPYKSPVLTIHGTVKDVTRAIGRSGSPDGGTRFGRTNTKL